MKTKKLVVFDLDQTLVYTLPRFHRVFCKQLGRNIAWDEFIRAYAEDSLNKYILEDGRNIEDFWKAFLKSYFPPHPEDRLISGAETVLRALKENNYAVVVHTGRIVDEELIWEELRGFGVDNYIDEIYPEDDEFRVGTFDKSIKLIEIREKYTPDRFIYVGDYWPDMVSGKKAGAFVIGVLTGLEKEEKLKKFGADVVIESVARLMEVIHE